MILAKHDIYNEINHHETFQIKTMFSVSPCGVIFEIFVTWSYTWNKFTMFWSTFQKYFDISMIFKQISNSSSSLTGLLTTLKPHSQRKKRNIEKGFTCWLVSFSCLFLRQKFGSGLVLKQKLCRDSLNPDSLLNFLCITKTLKMWCDAL